MLYLQHIEEQCMKTETGFFHPIQSFYASHGTDFPGSDVPKKLIRRFLKYLDFWNLPEK